MKLREGFPDGSLIATWLGRRDERFEIKKFSMETILLVCPFENPPGKEAIVVEISGEEAKIVERRTRVCLEQRITPRNTWLVFAKFEEEEEK